MLDAAPENTHEIRDRSMIRAVALDLDGVVYEGDRVIDGAVETINRLRECGVDVYFVTNNSGKKRVSIAIRLNEMGIEATIDHIITSGYTAAVLVNSLCNTQNHRVLLLGSEELEEEFVQFQGKVVHELPANILVVGFDRTFDFEKLSLGLTALRSGTTFVACNRDRVFPVGNNQVLPACGPMVSALEWASGKEADYVVGKPNTMMLKQIVYERGFKPQEILVVGDSVESDIAMALQFGCPSVLIARDGLQNSVMEEMRPTFIIHSIAQLLTVVNGNGQMLHDRP